MQHVPSGLAAGGVFALLALALLIIHRSTGVINFAQGEMATLSAYIAWTLIVNHGWGYWPAAATTLGRLVRRRRAHPPRRHQAGGARERAADRHRDDRPAHRHQRLHHLAVERRAAAAQGPFGTSTYNIGDVVVSAHEIGTICVALGIVVLLWALFRFTKLGLALRAAAVNPEEARLVGVRVTWMLALGWVLGHRPGRCRPAHRAVELRARPEHDGARPHLRLRGGGARRDRLAARRRRRVSRSASS